MFPPILLLPKAVHVTPFGVVHVFAARFVICGETVRADVLLDGAMAAVVRSGIGVEKLRKSSVNSAFPAPNVDNTIKRKNRYYVVV